ncbi:SgrR family transcriptional regulator [Paucibacter oligotrophus]|uniref:SgrR family transcriptional regulator n=1 Tax=Roseateles oligotrophus TaxID=1769250 RepID=A0A840L942_9BURK|nr:ABC transporter substrate-binding protein [Roseateles oligotrophus]MBB4844690.1 SgrR family transcriptional regulator [Roseateles oligotrophus]
MRMTASKPKPAPPAAPSLLREQYIRLAEGLPSPASLSLGAVAERLCCGERNARLLLARMQAQTWLSWTPSRGRGRLSTLTLHQDPGALRVLQLQQLLEDGRVEAAFRGLPPAARSRVKQALPAFLGASPGGGLRMPFYRPLHALDPIHVTRRTEAHMVSQLCERLSAYDLTSESIVPALAHHWESREDGRCWRLWLRPGLRFQDGRPLRARDAAASLLRLRDTAGPHRALMSHLQDIACKGQRLDLQLLSPDHLLPHRLAHHACAILPEGDWARPDFTQLPIGAGAFRLLRNNEHRATLQAFEGYWGIRPLLDQIDLWVVPAGSAMPAVDIKLGQQSTQAHPGQQKRWQVLQQAEQGCDFVLLKPSRPAFATAAARCAIGHWLRSHVAGTTPGTRFRPARAWLPAWQHLLRPDPRPPAAPPLPRQLLMFTYELDEHIALARRVIEACEAAGSSVRLEVVSAPEFAAGVWHGPADLVVAGEVLGDDMEFGQYSALSGEAGFHAWLPPALRKSLATICRATAAEALPAQRLAAMESAFRRLALAGAFLPMRHVLQQLTHAPELGGVALARCGWMDFRKLWLPGA